MIQFTPLQKKVLRDKGLCNVNYRDMYQSSGAAGYCSKGGLKYEVNIATDVPDAENTKDIILLHELGHIFYGHVDHVDLKEEFKAVEQICKDLGRDYKAIMQIFEGPMNFLNICMDMQINSTILNQGNLKIMKDAGLGLWTVEAAEISSEVIMNSSNPGAFRDYYKPLIETVPPETEMDAQQMQQMIQDMIKKFKENVGNQRGNAGGSGAGVGKAMQDLPSTGNVALDDDISDELAGALQDEDYVGGEVKKQRNDKVQDGRKVTVDDVVNANEAKNNPDADTEQAQVVIPNRGSGAGDAEIIVDTGDPNTAVSKFLASLVETKREYQNDVLKHYNRGTRMNPDGIMYNSKRVKRHTDKKKMGIVIDVSGSMRHEAIIEAIHSIDAAALDKNSLVATWDDGKTPHEEFLISKMPDTIKGGGGTDMSRGLKYLVDKGMKDIVIYSDFGTDMDRLIEEAEAAIKKGVKIYSIITAAVGHAAEEAKELNENPRYEKFKIYFKKYCRKNLIVGINGSSAF